MLVFYYLTKNPEQLINCYEQLFKTVKPEYMRWDMEKAVDSKTFSDFLKDQGVKLYHTFSKTKVSIAEQMIRTLKEKCEKIKTQYELEEKNYISYMIYYHMFLKNIILKQFIALYKWPHLMQEN